MLDSQEQLTRQEHHSVAHKERRRARLLRFLPVVLFLCVAAPAVACPFCKDGVCTDQSGTKTAAAAGLDFNTSIYAMLAGLAGVGGFTARTMYKAAKSTPQDRQDD